MLDFNNLWLTRAFPENINRIEEFLQEDIIALGWSKLPDMTGKDKDAINNELQLNNYGNSNVTIGVLNHFFNKMNIGDLCIIPDGDKIYLAKITSDYHYNPSKLSCGYAHQRDVEFINKNNPINRSELPDELKKSLGAQNSVANLNHRIKELKEFLENPDTSDTNIDLKEKLTELLPKAIENIKIDLNCDDPERRLKVSLEIINILQKYNL